uniref:Uncharacterized protein n=1 Tax=Noctiluca scintillans TaxID=2966 RepID=A0A7S1F1S3_NOCSC
MSEAKPRANPGKPRVLLSIVKCANFEQSDEDSLITAISAGFGYFECDRLLKPSGIELMNLPQSATIEIQILRRERGKTSKVLVCHGLVPLNALHPEFFTVRGIGDDRLGASEPLVWESWLGLLSADVSLKSQSPERLFKRCIEMGTSESRGPRLFIQLQYLQAGVVASKGESAGMDSRPRRPSSRPATSLGSVSSPRRTSPSPLAPGVREELRGNTFGLPLREGLRTRESVTSVSREEQASGSMPLLWSGLSGLPPKEAGDVKGARSTVGSSGLFGARPTMGGSVYHASPTPKRSERELSTSDVAAARRDSDGDAMFGVKSLPTRRSSESQPPFLVQHLPQHPQQQKACASSMDGSQDLSGMPMWNPSKAMLTPSAGTEESQQRSLVQAERDRKFSRDDLRPRPMTVNGKGEMQTLPEHRESRRDVSERHFLDQAKPLLQQLGCSLPTLSEPRAPELQFRDVLGALSSVASVHTTPVSLMERAMDVALNGEVAFEHWLSELDSDSSARLEKAETFMSSCRQVASLASRSAHDRPESGALAMPFHVPVLSDPVDCLLAAQLLKLDFEAPLFKRIDPGLYQVGPKVRIHCRVERGTILVTPLDKDFTKPGSLDVDVRTFLEYMSGALLE